MSDTLADRLAAFALDTRYEDLPGRLSSRPAAGWWMPSGAQSEHWKSRPRRLLARLPRDFRVQRRCG